VLVCWPDCDCDCDCDWAPMFVEFCRARGVAVDGVADVLYCSNSAFIPEDAEGLF
jgi:hypothetical protein